MSQVPLDAPVEVRAEKFRGELEDARAAAYRALQETAREYPPPQAPPPRQPHPTLRPAPPPPASPPPAPLQAVVALLREAGLAEIALGEMGGLLSLPARDN